MSFPSNFWPLNRTRFATRAWAVYQYDTMLLKRLQGKWLGPESQIMPMALQRGWFNLEPQKATKSVSGNVSELHIFVVASEWGAMASHSSSDRRFVRISGRFARDRSKLTGSNG